MAIVVKGPYRCHSLTTAQLASVQSVLDHSSWDFGSFPAPIELYAVDPGKFIVDGKLTQAWGSTDYPTRRVEVWPGLNAVQFRYGVLHETAHIVSGDFLDATTKDDLMGQMLPLVPNGTTWKNPGGPYKRHPSESFAHQFAVSLYLGTGDWGSVDSGGKANKNGYYRYYFGNNATARTTIETAVGDGSGDSGGDGTDDGVVEFDTLRDVSLRKKVGTTTKQGAGHEQHIPLGLLGVPGDRAPDYLHWGLVQFDTVWPDDIDTITSAQLELTVTASNLDPHLSASGASSVLQAAMVLTGWTEGSHAEGDWSATDFRDPTWDTKIRTLGPVGTQVAGTRMSFDAMAFVKQWAPTTVKVGTLGKGLDKTNHGLMLKVSKQDKIIGATVFASKEHPTTAYRPTLFITYTPISVAPVAFPQSPEGDVASTVFNFSAEYSDPLGKDHLGSFDLQVRDSGTLDTIWNVSEQANANSQATGVFVKSSANAPAGTWRSGRASEWRCRVKSAISGKTSPWTDWTAFTITGAVPTVTAQQLGTLATLDNVYFGGPYTDPQGVVTVSGTQPPVGFARMSMWLAYWKSRDIANIRQVIQDMLYMHLDGVVLMGKDWGGSTTELPADVVAKLDLFIAAGIKPYVGLWMGEFNSIDNTAALAAWNAGSGRWAGAVIDAENGWVKSYNGTNGVYGSKAAAAAALTGFIGSLRAAGCDFIVYHGYGDPDFWDAGDHDYGWNVWNGLTDMVMPHADTPNTIDQVRRTINRYQRAFDEHASSWSNPLPPLVWLHNGYSIGADAPTRRYAIERGLEEQGAVSMWHYPLQNTAVRDVFHSIPPLAPVNTYRIVNTRIQVRTQPQGDPAWTTDDGLLWDTGEVALTNDERTSGRIRRLYGGKTLTAGTYTYRVEVQNVAGAWSDWSYATFTLTVGVESDPGAIDFLSGYARKKMDRRIVIRDMSTGRGPGAVKAILYDASNIGFSTVANDTGELYFTIPTTHPQASEIEPLQRHYSVEFYRGGVWKALAEGLITDMDATENDVVFYGLDYMGLLSKTVETAFYNWDSPDSSIDAGGAKYIDKAISYVIKDQLSREHAITDSPVGFISVEGQGSHTLMEDVPAHVTINAAFRERLAFILGLIQSAKQGTGNRSRLWPEHAADGSFRWRFKNNAGVNRDNLRLKYGELIQGFHIVLLGNAWAAKVYGAGRVTNESKLRFKSASAPGIDTAVWGNVAMPALWQDLNDENDLQRRVKQMAMEAGKFGKSVALGLRVNGLEILDGFDLMDNVPVDINRGAVDTSRYGSGYWTIQGVQYRLFPDGHDELTLAVKPREDSSSPDSDLIPSRPISTAPEWSRTGIVGTGLTLSTASSLRADGTVAASLTASWDPITSEGFGYYVVQVAANGTSDFSNAITIPTNSAHVTLQDMLPGQSYSARVGAFDTSGLFSGFGASATRVAAIDAVAPAQPSNLVVSPIINGLLISWNPVTDLDLAHYEVNYVPTGSTGTDAVSILTKTTAVSVSGLQSPADFSVMVRAIDLSGNASTWTPSVIETTRQVIGDDIGPGEVGNGNLDDDSVDHRVVKDGEIDYYHLAIDAVRANNIKAGVIETWHITTDGLDAGVIKTGTLVVGGASADAPTFKLYDSGNNLVIQMDANGSYFYDPDNEDNVVRILDGSLEISSNGGASWDNAISGAGIRATAITVGVMPGGHNLIPNSSFEGVPFTSPASHVWTAAGDWGTTIGTDVGVDKSTGQLKISVVTY